MSVITQGPGYLEVRYDEEVDDAHDAATVLKMRFDVRQYGSLSLHAWAEDENVKVTLKRLVGYDGAGLEVWQDEVAEQTLTAAANAEAVNPATEVTTIYHDGARYGTYALFARRAADTGAGTLHVFGHVKAGGANDFVPA